MDTTKRYYIFYSVFILSLLISNMSAQESDLPKCNYNLSNGILIVDQPSFRSEAIKYCEERSAILAPVQTQEDLDEIQDELRDCMDSKGEKFYREKTVFMVNLEANYSVAVWSNGVDFKSKLHDLAESRQAHPLPFAVDECYYYRFHSRDGLFSVACKDLEESKVSFLCKILPAISIVTPASSSVAVTVIVILLIVIVLVAAVAIAYKKKEWINNKVFGTPA